MANGKEFTVVQATSIVGRDGQRTVTVTPIDGGRNALEVRATGTVLTQLPRYGLSEDGSARSSFPYNIWSMVNRYGPDPREVAGSASISASITPDLSSSSVILAVSASAGAMARARSQEWFVYEANRPVRVLGTIIHDAPGLPGQMRRWGIFDDRNGVFMILSGTSLGVGIRSDTSGAPIDMFISQSAWNIDRMDGTGPSGIRLDVTKMNIYEGTFAWLGAGPVVYAIDRRVVHVQETSNSASAPFMRTAVLPAAAEIENVTGQHSGSMKFVCTDVSADNGYTRGEYGYAVGLSSTFSTTTANETPILSIRLKQLYNSIDNRATINPHIFSAYAQGSNDAIFRLRHNAILTFPIGTGTWSSVHDYSVVEYNTDATAVSGGEEVIGAIFVAAPDSIRADLKDSYEHISGGRRIKRDSFTGVSDTLTVTVQRILPTNPTVQAALEWGELK